MSTQEAGDLPAFPVVSETIGHCSGMTLRDYFAAAALQGMLASCTSRDLQMSIIRDAYVVAHLMLIERKNYETGGAA